MLAFGNIFFFIFHTLLILFNVLGWTWVKTRKWNLLTLGMTFCSWCVMGIWKGVGYCICTDWHWQIRHAMGIKGDPDSYLILLVQKLTGWTPSVSLTNTTALIVFIASTLASVTLNFKDWKKRRENKRKGDNNLAQANP
jgi:hypothetical protein